jgi:uncharacterized membrane protein YqhA
MEQAFERLLCNSRLMVLVAVVSSLVLAAGMLFTATIDVVELVLRYGAYANLSLTEEARYKARLGIVGGTIEVVDGYLLGAVLLIFALGLYELFISKIDAIERSEVASRLLLIRSFDDLKSRLASVVLLILVVKFFQQALRIKYETPFDLLQLGIGIVFVGGALFLGQLRRNERP